ncbi:MAG: aminodeoxychorismate synthase component I [Terracidiphilus sp.]|jgi:para-aminobenzoate synthetase/4-amino-4-deoxychorismate lyase
MKRWHSPPAELYALVEQTPATVLLECARPGATRPHPESPSEAVSRLFTAPLRVCVANQPAELPKLFAEIESAIAAGLFAAGYFAYECGNCFEPKAGMYSGRAGQPLAWFGIYDRAWLFDHRKGAFLDGEPLGLARFSALTQNEAPAPELQLECSFGLTEPEFAERIAAIHEWIRSGDVYQLNFTVPIQVRAQGCFAALYRRLHRRQPVEYGAFLHSQPGRRILSLSPELFFRIEREADSRRIVTRPMKGTAPRGRNNREDRALAEWLRNDPKNRAENIMIVDLLRNDLGRLCAFGSVRADDLFAVERYPTLLQMTSTVAGALRPEITFQQIFRALFPCGSITGAPKVRAMQLLAEIEPEPRGVYTGAIGFFSRRKTVFSVAIRTLELDGARGKMGVGSGIVIDSNAAEEFRECLLKAEFLTGSAQSLPERFSLIETLLWQGDYPLLELHLDRLMDSAEYFDIPCGRAEVKAALVAHAAGFTGAQASASPQVPRAPSFPLFAAERVGEQAVQSAEASRKVRLLLDADGAFVIADELLPAHANPVRVRIARQRTDPQDRMLFHKTTHRPLYAEAFNAAVQAGYDDALFLNRRGEVTESAIGNIFMEKNGRWFTPPVECGLLAGVYRRHMLETRPFAEERVLYVEDLRKADAVYLSNAVRGLRRVTIDWTDESIPRLHRDHGGLN